MHEILIYDEPSPCPYLSGQVARLPLRQVWEMTPDDFDEALARGDRRVGELLYRTNCPRCRACEPIRIPIRDFEAGRTQIRMKRRGDAMLRLRIDEPTCDEARVDLYNRHKQLRGLQSGEGLIDAIGYTEFLVNTCVETLELSYWHGEQLVAVAISDRGAKAMNAVYCYFEPEFVGVSLGTYNVMKQIELCATWKIDYLYLGFYIAESNHMKYKASYLPHDRRSATTWVRYDR